jgi:hypothetical protein
MSENNDPRSIAQTYIEAMGRRDFATVGRLLAPDVTFEGPSGKLAGPAVLVAYERLGPILLRNDVRKVFVDGEEVCVIYDFVTDTPGGAVATVERLRIADGRIRSIWLLFDRGPWPAVMAELTRRTAVSKAG